MEQSVEHVDVIYFNSFYFQVCKGFFSFQTICINFLTNDDNDDDDYYYDCDDDDDDDDNDDDDYDDDDDDDDVDLINQLYQQKPFPVQRNYLITDRLNHHQYSPTEVKQYLN